MPSFHAAEVVEILEELPGLQRVRVRFDAPRAGDRAFVLTELIGTVALGDRVVCNTSAVDLGLGTGGWHPVHWNLARTSIEAADAGHVMKLRYTSLQVATGTSELAEPVAERLDGMTAVGCLVHSQIPVVAAAVRAADPDLRIAYVMTDGASLPIALSDTVRALRSAGLVERTVTTGHAFGGDLEAVTVASALGLARAAGAEVALVGMGPGVVGTGTRLGTTAIDTAAHLDVAAALGATPLLCVRSSDGDARERHHGVSHHTETVAALCQSRPWVAAVPPAAAELPRVRVYDSTAVRAWAEADVDSIDSLLGTWRLRVTTMGRGPAQDLSFFRSAAATGQVAAELARSAGR